MSLAFTSDSRSLAFFSPSNLYLWHFEAAAEPQRVAIGTAGGVQTGLPIYLWHFDSSVQRHRVTSGIVGRVQSLAFAPDGQELLAADPNGEIAILEVATGKQISSLRVRAQSQPGNLALNLSPDGLKLALITATGLGVDLWNPKTGKLLYSLPEESSLVNWLAWSPDNQRLAVARDDGKIAIWNLQTVREILAQLGLGLNP
jgi:WD40 repeat protein